ncbi:C40 family peptidase [Aneurinibacillus migulanus]|uniref:C40 family peptidase n=1 Tax=Aneurinibacillus migulanus TaxID=47500 RepID=UPI0020A08ADD|nr:C40 family peptidase [Aneurinibacillus migulanus]MCP1356157.1 C40 family peptidase [Aneurinibacillus migulanus]
MTQVKQTGWAVATTVATVWTAPESPRTLDVHVLGNPSDIEGWIGSMSLDDKLELHDRNLVQTQALYGTPVEILEDADDWIRVAIPDQASRKESRGYPGWMPRRQVKENTEYMAALEKRRWAVVSRPKTRLYRDRYSQGIVLSFLTRLPVLAQDEEWITVATPDGPQLLWADDVTVTDGSARKDAECGFRILETGKMFLGLPYLWGGMSSFGYDCSGFAYSMHKSQGIIIPRDASDQAMYGKEIAPEDLAPGDLLFFAYEEGRGAVHHVGIYAGAGMMIHSPETISSVEIIPLRGYKYENEHCISRRYWE